MSSPNDSMVKNYSVLKSFAVLEFLATVKTPKDLGLISSELRMNKSTLYRFLSTLVKLGYANKDSQTGRYSLGSKVVWLASRFLESLDIRTLSHPLLERLVEVTGETVQLAILDNYEVVYVDKVDGHQPVRRFSSLGDRMPAHCTGSGKALLASLDEDEWSTYIKNIGLKSYTPNTIQDAATFYKEMRAIRECGYAIDNCENEEGIRCVAASITNHLGKAVAAISVSGWTVTMTPERDTQIAPLIRQTAREISELLGAVQRT